MATYPQARSATLAAFEMVAKLGVTVLTARPKEIESGWCVEIETARKVPEDLKLEVDGVPIIVWDHGFNF